MRKLLSKLDRAVRDYLDERLVAASWRVRPKSTAAGMPPARSWRRRWRSASASAPSWPLDRLSRDVPRSRTEGSISSPATTRTPTSSPVNNSIQLALKITGPGNVVTGLLPAYICFTQRSTPSSLAARCERQSGCCAGKTVSSLQRCYICREIRGLFPR